MNYLKVTMNNAELLRGGYPRHDLCEIDGERVIRRIQGWDDGRLVKQSLEGADAWRVKKGLRESTPELSWNKPGADFLVEEISKESFEDAWSKAQLVGEGWG